MTSVLLIYPYFNPANNRSIFRFPPLGLGYVASSLRDAGYDVDILDCTFMNKNKAIAKARESGADIVGIYSMVTMREDCLWFAKCLRKNCALLIAGGPQASCDPVSFMEDFDVVIRGEGEKAMIEVIKAYESSSDMGYIQGIVCWRNNEIFFTGFRQLDADLDSIAFPARDLFQNDRYIGYSKSRFGHAITTIMTTRGCPFSCEFCNNAVFGISYRERSPGNVLLEVKQALSLGYDRIHFADDVFTLNKKRIIILCEKIKMLGLDFKWECLGRVDSIDRDVAAAMKDAGCDRIFFGIESGSDPVLKIMNKKITIDKARGAVNAAHEAGIRTGAFFILCYPGENDDTVLETLRFSTSLPLDYLSFTVPYPLPGTQLYERVKDSIKKEWKVPDGLISDHVLIYDSDFSEIKMKFAILKGQAQFWMRKKFGDYANYVVKPFEMLTDAVFRAMK
jgi:anaerobic magnesium-protoporphyrin IX monomethyl ester cyclase